MIASYSETSIPFSLFFLYHTWGLGVRVWGFEFVELVEFIEFIELVGLVELRGDRGF